MTASSLFQSTKEELAGLVERVTFGKEHGLQFQANTLKAVPPNTTEGVEHYLAGGFIKGIGRVLTEKLAARFGPEVLSVIGEGPQELEAVEGIGPKRRARITRAWQDGVEIRQAMLFLHSHCVSTALAVRMYKTYDAQAIEKVRENPYPRQRHPRDRLQDC